MEISNYLLSVIWFLLVPGIVGCIWLRAEDELSVDKLVENWIYGTVMLMGTAQLLLIPMIARHVSFLVFVTAWCVCILALGIVGAVKFAAKAKNFHFKWELSKKWHHLIQGLCLFLVIMGQCVATSYLQHADADDARFVAEAVLAVEQNRMYLDSPITGEEMGELIGEVRKDLTSPWTMYLALMAKLCNTAPAILAHKVMPFYYVLFFYAIIALIGFLVFAQRKDKVFWYLMVISVFNMFDYISTHTISTVLLLRLWQGKAFVAAGILPLLLYSFLKLQEEQNSAKALWGIGITAMAAALASGIGNILTPILIFVYGIADWLKCKNNSKTVKIWAMMIPNLIYLICQYKFFEIFIAPWC